MLFRDINTIPEIKRLCKTILEGFLANRDNFTMNDESNLLTDYIKEVMENKSNVEKDNVMKSMCIYDGDGDDCDSGSGYYRSLMEKMGDYYDITEPLLIICDNICKYHYTELYPCGWDDNGEGIWVRPLVAVATAAS
jgi:archaellum biogenesis ATPase FlaH